MKPEELVMKNFGPFENETVDFEKLDSMFLIRGNTGSGKTTIFDAISYALYGKYTGVRQSLAKKALRSHFASESAESSVTLTFSVDGSRFRVQRTLPYIYTNRNGKETQKDSSVTLEAEKDGGWILFAGKNNETDAKIERDIIKLPFDEFNKIVVLPQGEFAKFLRQNSSERSETLRKIFPVENVTKTVEAISARTKELRAELSSIEKQIAEMDAESSMEELEKTSCEHEGKIKSLNEKISLLSREIQEKTEVLSETKKKIENAQKAKSLEEEILKLKSLEKEIRQKSVRLGESKKAQDFVALITKSENLEKQLSDTEKRLLSEKACVTECENELSALDAHAEEIRELEEKNKADEKKISELEKRLEITREVEETREILSAAKASFLSATKKAEDTKKEKEELEKTVRAIASESVGEGEKEKISGEINSIMDFLLETTREKGTAERNSSTILENAQKAKKAAEEAEASREKFLKAQEECARAEKNLSATKAILQELEERQKHYEQNHMASIIALGLKAGLPCPVCGSTDHPNPAKDDEPSLSEKIESQKENVSKCEKDFRAAQNAFIASQTVAAEKEKQLEQFKTAAKYEEAFAEHEKAKNEKLRADSSYERARSCSGKINILSQKFFAESKKASEAGAEVSRLEGTLAEKEKHTGANDTPDSIQKEIASLKKIFAADAIKIEDFRKNSENLKSSLTAARGRKEQLEETKKKTEEESKIAQAELSEKMKTSGFNGVDEIKRKILPARELDALQNEVDSWKTELNAKETLLESVRIFEDYEELSSAQEKISADLDEANKKIEVLGKEAQEKAGELSTIRSKIQRHEELEKKRRDISGANETLILLSKDLTGDNPKNIQFADWILAMHLAEVIDYANVRLHELSRGRYQFTIEKTTNRGNHGLDIAINDASTGQNRNPATLSGGETFQASISLALAMTDVVESHSGGIKLESLFIDEGFGTLDSDALKTAVSILKKIELADKKVGIISHVEALQNEIPSQISVEGGRIAIV